MTMLAESRERIFINNEKSLRLSRTDNTRHSYVNVGQQNASGPLHESPKSGEGKGKP